MALLYDPISAQGVENLKGYCYAGVDNSIIYKMMLPLLQWYLDHVVPLWMAPNLLTLLGLLAMIIAYILLSLIYCADMVRYV